MFSQQPLWPLEAFELIMNAPYFGQTLHKGAPSSHSSILFMAYHSTECEKEGHVLV